MNSDSIVLTGSDAGWINGHTYALFGPLSLGATTILLEKPIAYSIDDAKAHLEANGVVIN